MAVSNAVPNANKLPQPEPDHSIIFAKIETIEKQLRELKESSVLPRGPSRLDEAKLSPVQEEVLRILSSGVAMTAEETAKAVDRTRPLMVINLNQLVALGLLERERRGKRVYFQRKSQMFLNTPEKGRGGCYMFAILVSDNPPKNIKDGEFLLRERLKDMPHWKLERVSLLPKTLTESDPSEKGR